MSIPTDPETSAATLLGQTGVNQEVETPSITTRIGNRFRRLSTRNPPQEPPSNQEGFLVKKTDLLKTDSSGAQANRERIGTSAQEGDNDKITIPEHLRKKYTSILSEYTANLVRLKSTNPNIFNSAAHQHESILLSMFTDETGQVNTEKISDLMRSEGSGQGMALATLIIEQQLSYKAFAMGLDMSVVNVGATRLPGELVSSRLDRYIDQGNTRTGRTLGRLRDTTIGGRVAKVIGAGGGGVLGYGVGTVAGNVAGQVVGGLSDFITNIDFGFAPGPAGAFLGAVVGGMGGYQAASRFSSESRRPLGVSTTALQTIQNDPLEAEYVRAMTGINVRDYRVMHGRIELNPARIEETTGQSHHIESTIAMLTARKEFYEVLGYPADKRARAVDLRFSSHEAGTPAKLITVWEERVKDHLNLNGVYAATLDPRERMKMMLEARQKVIVEMLEEQSVRMNTRNSMTQRHVDIIRAAQTALRDESETAYKNHYEEEIAALNIDRSIFNEIESKLRGTRGESDFTEEERTINERFPSVQLDERIASLDTEIGGINLDEFEALRSEIELEAQTATTALLNNPQIEALMGRVGGRTDRGTIDSLRGLIASLQEPILRRQNRRMESIDQQEREARDRLQALQVERDQLRLILHKRTVSENAPERNSQTTRMRNDYAAVIRCGISTDLLRSGPMQELLSAVNGVYEAAVSAGNEPPPGTWPASMNDNPANRAILLHARIEAQFRSRRTNNGQPPHERCLQYISGFQSEIDRQIQNANYMLEHYNPSELIRQAELVLEVGARENETMCNTLSVNDEVFSMSRLRDNRSVDDADQSLTTQEKEFAQQMAAAVPPFTVRHGYLELMNNIFRYKERPDRGEFFQRIVQLLPPNELMDVIRANIPGFTSFAMNMRTPTDVRRIYIVLSDHMYSKMSAMLSSRS